MPKALTDAAGRRVGERLILPSYSDSAIVFHARGSHYSGLLEAGVKLYERQSALLHSETALIDGFRSRAVGSTHLDWRSFLANDEVNAVILGRAFGRRMHAMFATDLEASVAIDPDSWARHPLSFRIKEWMAQLWGRLL